ncbi:MAG: hypothetical protein VYB54_00240 [Pseudomonadota bacterium]|nr:hypothetical protein [Pseudomonadota bacterium]
MPGFFLIDRDSALRPLNQEEPLNEAQLHGLLDRHPEMLTGAPLDADGPAPYLLVRSEFPIQDRAMGQDRWSLDIMLLGRDGTPTMVEVKRAGDPRLRREVVAQMLDYAANGLASMSAASLRDSLAARVEAPDAVLDDFLGPEQEADDFWSRVQDKLDARDIRLVFAANVIPPELRTLVEFLNEQMQTVEVLAVEVRQHVADGMRMVSSELIGRTGRAAQRKGVERTAGPAWTRQEFLEAVGERRGPEAARAMDNLLEWARIHGWPVALGRRPTGGVLLKSPSGTRKTLLGLMPDGQLEFYLPQLADESGVEIASLRTSLAAISELGLTAGERFPKANAVSLGSLPVFAAVTDLLARATPAPDDPGDEPDPD